MTVNHRIHRGNIQIAMPLLFVRVAREQ